MPTPFRMHFGSGAGFRFPINWMARDHQITRSMGGTPSPGYPRLAWFQCGHPKTIPDWRRLQRSGLNWRKFQPFSPYSGSVLISGKVLLSDHGDGAITAMLAIYPLPYPLIRIPKDLTEVIPRSSQIGVPSELCHHGLP